MTSRSGTDDERNFAVWSGKRPRMPIGSPRVLIAHQDKLIAESLGALLRLTGWLQVMQTQNLKSARSLLQKLETPGAHTGYAARQRLRLHVHSYVALRRRGDGPLVGGNQQRMASRSR